MAIRLDGNLIEAKLIRVSIIYAGLIVKEVNRK